jgi:hypothetical protein
LPPEAPASPEHHFPETNQTSTDEETMSGIAALSIEERIDRLESIEAIKRLKARYAEFADGKYTADHRKKPQEERDAVAWQQALCFTEDAEWKAFENFRDKPFLFALHIYMNPLIEVDGDAGKGRWAHWLLVTEDATGKPVHMGAYTLDEYRRVDGEWLFSRVELVQKFMVPFGQPWTPAALTQTG